MLLSEEDDRGEEPVKVPIEEMIDLHTFAPKEIPDLLESYLGECRKAGFREVRIIHGKGAGIQRKIVHAFLQKSPLIERFFQAPPETGGWGATIAVLRSPAPDELSP